MRKMLISLTTVGLLAVPAGVAMAQSDTPDPVGPVPTCVDPQHDRDRDRDRDRTADQTVTESHEQLRIHERTQLHDGTGVGDGAMYRYQHEYQHEARNG